MADVIGRTTDNNIVIIRKQKSVYSDGAYDGIAFRRADKRADDSFEGFRFRNDGTVVRTDRNNQITRRRRRESGDVLRITTCDERA